jgi:hypothetical protein
MNMTNQKQETAEERSARIAEHGYKPEDETVEERLTRHHNRFIEHRGGVDGNGLSEQGHAILFELRYCLTGKCEHTMKIGKL